MKNQKGFIPVIIILVVLIGFAGVYYLGTLKPKTITNNPTSMPVVSISPSAEPTLSKGLVNGKLCYPSDFLPQGEIIAKDVLTNKIYTQEYKGSGNGGSQNFTFELPVGTYHLKYQAHPSAKDPSLYTSLYHTACAINNEYNFCQIDSNHKIINTVIKKDVTVSEVLLCDSGSTPTQEQGLNSSY